MININEKETIKNTDDLLKEYECFKRLAYGANPQITINNGTDRKTIDALTILNDINNAFDNLSNANLKEILTKKYIERYFHFDYELYKRMNLSESTYYRRLKKAQIQFAEAFKGWNLVVFNESEKIH